MMNFAELDENTRRYMATEFDLEQASDNPYCGELLSPKGSDSWPGHFRYAVQHGNEESLTLALNDASYWNATEPYERNGIVRDRAINILQAATRLSLNEFNTWYVRGLAKRLLDEGVMQCQAYRGMMPKWEPGECATHEGQIFSVEEIYAGHRARYWPKPGNPHAVSIPFTPGCHHTIRRVPRI